MAEIRWINIFENLFGEVPWIQTAARLYALIYNFYLRQLVMALLVSLHLQFMAQNNNDKLCTCRRGSRQFIRAINDYVYFI